MPQPDKLLPDLRAAARADSFVVESFGSAGPWPLLALSREGQASQGRRIYLSAGIHGDEPAGVLALLELLREGSLPHAHHYTIFPLLNPVGLASGQRHNGANIDLNRDYSRPQSPEIQNHTAWLDKQVGPLDLGLLLHEDWEARGFYLYELNFGAQPSLAARLLEAAADHLPIETSAEIDGHPAEGGIIRPPSLPEVPGGDPEAIHLYKRFGGVNYTLETPSGRPLAQRVAAHKAAVLAALQHIGEQKIDRVGLPRN